MPKSKVKMPKSIKNKCLVPIHAAATAAGASAAIPIPLSDTIPITAAQVGMVVALGNVFDVTISESIAKAVIGCGLAKNVGRTLVSAILKAIPGANALIAPVVCTITAASFTEALGWVIADDFFRMSRGEQPDNIIDKVDDLKVLFKDSLNKTQKRNKTKSVSRINSNNKSKKINNQVKKNNKSLIVNNQTKIKNKHVKTINKSTKKSIK